MIWSPYYQVRFKPKHLSIDVNNIGHQSMLRVNVRSPGYLLPHLLNRDAGGKPFEDVLIIGAGSGNDVAAACARGAGTSTPSRSTRSSTTWDGFIIPTGHTATRESQSTGTTAADSFARRSPNTT